ncbi:ATP-binding protein [Thalassovita sp.]|uniref:ATP-binding protein n=1 Tax=Thalassovita sp. TaxID=1979401 RepID=UPI002B270D4F|nr:ATP-binding protein [Thalassovita sp.]
MGEVALESYEIGGEGHLETLRRIGLFDEEREARFDRLTKMIRNILDTDECTVTIIDEERQFFKSAASLLDDPSGACETPLSHSLCALVAKGGRPLAIGNGPKDSRFAHHLAIVETGIASYLGVPIHLKGRVIGSLCVHSADKRDWSDRDREIMYNFAKIVDDEIELSWTADAHSRAHQKAKSESKAKTEFVSSVTHELRTPLTGLVGYSELLSETDLSATQREYLNNIQNACQSLTSLVDDVLDFSKIEAGKLDIKPEPFSIDTIIDNSLSIMASVADQKGVALKKEIDPNLPEFAVGDGPRLQQVLLNLLGNAIKFTNEGSVGILLKRPDVQADTNVVRFEISDTGVGIPGNRKNQIFERFVQADTSVHVEFGGTGLGLPICKKIIEAMGGEIGVSSAEGVGSTFWFAVPLPEADRTIPVDQQPKSEDQRETRNSSEKIRILVAEDNQINRGLFKVCLDKLEIDHEIASDGIEAIKLYENGDFDMIFTDCQMPILDGYELTKKVRSLSDRSKAQVPIVAVTASAMQADIDRCLDTGMDGVLIKPFSISDLNEQITRWSVGNK